MNRDKVIDLSAAGHGDFVRTRPKWFEALWMIMERMFITSLQPSSRLRAMLLRLFGSKIGRNVILRPRLRVKFPWNLKIGNNCWIGEGVWLHNQAMLTIGDNVVISQESFITTGSHEYRNTMDLIVKPVLIKEGAWITSRCIITLGVEIGENALVTPGSVVNVSLEPNGVYTGNPAKFVKWRWKPDDAEILP